MISVEAGISDAIFKFSGQTEMDTWMLKENTAVSAAARYSRWLINDFHLSMQRIKEIVDSFPFWQRTRLTGRPPANERDLLIGYLLRQFFDLTFRQTQGLMGFFKDYFGIVKVPSHTLLSKKNQSKRWFLLWKRFHRFIMDGLPKRKAIIATDASGFSGRKRGWKETPHDHRANQDWVKIHAAVEIDSFLIVNYELTESDVHESQVFEDIWNDLPNNITPIRSLADAAYGGESCLQAALAQGATPIHGIKKNAVYHANPETAYQRLVNFATHWPNRFKELYGKRNHVETDFNMVQCRFGYRIRCRSKIGRKNEVQSKINAHDIRMLARMEFLNGN